MKVILPLAKISATLFLIFLFFSFLVSTNILRRFDILITFILQTIIPRAFDIPLSIFSLLGSFELLSLILMLLWLLNRKISYVLIPIGFIGFQFVEVLGKFFVNHPSPPSYLVRYDIPFSFPSSSFSTGFSYPSGHVGRTAFLSVVLIYLIYSSKKLSIFQKNIAVFLMATFLLIMTISRVYLGEHWTTDVIGGVILGASIGFLSISGYLFFKPFK